MQPKSFFAVLILLIAGGAVAMLGTLDFSRRFAAPYRGAFYTGKENLRRRIPRSRQEFPDSAAMP